jgi:hypothetical protein
MIAAMEESIKKGSRPEEQMQHRNYEGPGSPVTTSLWLISPLLSHEFLGNQVD